MSDLGGRYRIVQSLGTGGGGETFEAIDTRDNARVALKRLALAAQSDWKQLELFQREARVLSGLKHPAIPRLREHFVEGTVSYLAHDFAPGKSLRGWVEGGWRPTEAEVITIGAFLLDVLGYLHGLRPPVIHRDIKPANVIRGEDGRLSLVDFGAVRDTMSTQNSSTVVGTYGYMAPEQFRAQAVPATDIYGVAATLLYLLGGKPPTEYPQEKLKIAFKDAVKVSPFLARWLERALEPAPEDRFTDAADALAVLRGQKRADARVEPPKKAGLGRVLLLGGTLAFVVVAAAGIIGFDQWKQTRAATASPAARPSAPVKLERLPERTFGAEPSHDPVYFTGRHTNMINSLAIATNDRLVASGSDGVVKVWDRETKRELQSFGGWSGKVGGVAFTSDSKRVIGVGGTKVRVKDVASGDELEGIELSKPALPLALTRDDKTLFVATVDGVLHVFDFASRKETSQIPVSGMALTLALAKDETKIAVAGRRGDVEIFELPSGKLLTKFTPHTSDIGGVAFSPDGSLVATAGDDHRFIITGLRTSGQTVTDSEYRLDHEGWGVTFSPDGKLLVGASRDKTVSFIDVASRWRRSIFGTTVPMGQSVFTRDGTHIVIAGGAQLMEHTVEQRGLRTVLPEPDPKAPPLVPRDADHRRYLEAVAIYMQFPATPVSVLEAKVKEALAANSKAPLAWVANALVSLRHGYINGTKYDEREVSNAVDNLNHAAELGPKTAEWHAVNAWVQRAAKNPSAAHESIHQAPHDLFAMLCAGRIDAEEQKYAAAQGELAEVVRSNQPAYLSWAYQELVDAYHGLVDVDAQAAMYERSIAANRENAFAHGNYASFLFHHGDNEKAIAEAGAAIAIVPYGNAKETLAAAHAGLGDALLWEQHNDAKARVEYEEALKINPNQATAFYGRAAITRASAIDKKTPIDSARVDLMKAIALEPDWLQPKQALAELAYIK
jgi:WD40 repeat protein/Tfp pilus assembly protein PilF